jgi:hypothetical protein
VAKAQESKSQACPFSKFCFASICAFISGMVLQMERKIFWVLFIVLGTAMDIALPIWWGLALTLPLLVGCWWVAYKSGWFG